MEISLRGQKLYLSDWKPVGDKTTPNWVRRLEPYDGFSCVGLQVSYAVESPTSNRFHWGLMFHGPILHDLCDIYYRFYPSPQPYTDPPNTGKYYSCLSRTLLTFHDFQLQEAKDHLDQFIHRFNKLTVWI